MGRRNGAIEGGIEGNIEANAAAAAAELVADGEEEDWRSDGEIWSDDVGDELANRCDD